MKKVILSIIFIALVVLVPGVCGNIESHYTVDAEVVYTNSEIVTFEDVRGNLWDWEIVNEEFTVGESVKLKMFTAHTDATIIDDEIVKIFR